MEQVCGAPSRYVSFLCDDGLSSRCLPLSDLICYLGRSDNAIKNRWNSINGTMIRERMANFVEVNRTKEKKSHDLDSMHSFNIEQDVDEVRKDILSFDCLLSCDLYDVCMLMLMLIH